MTVLHREFAGAEDAPLAAELTAQGDRRFAAKVDGRVLQCEAEALPGGEVRFTIDGSTHRAFAVRVGDAMHVRLDGRTHVLPLRAKRARGGAATASSGAVEAPMTGTVLQVLVTMDQQVSAGDTVAVLSAMKMEHKLVAGIDGRVVALGAEPGATVDQGHVVVTVEAPESDE